MTDQEKYAEKIAALLRKAESTTPEEAELLFDKAAELMEKYKIDEAMLKAKQPESRGTVQRQDYYSAGIWLYPVAEMKWRIARAMGLRTIKKYTYGTQTINGKVYKKWEQYEMFGFDDDLKHFEMIITSLEVQMLRAELAWWKQNESSYQHFSPSRKHNVRRGFMFGFAQGAAERYLEVGRKVRKQADAEHGADSVALVLRDKKLEIDDAFNKAYPPASLRSVKDKKTRGDSAGYYGGVTAGRNADVGQSGVNPASKSLPTR